MFKYDERRAIVHRSQSKPPRSKRPGCGSLDEACLIRNRWRRVRSLRTIASSPLSTRRSVPLHVIDLPLPPPLSMAATHLSANSMPSHPSLAFLPSFHPAEPHHHVPHTRMPFRLPPPFSVDPTVQRLRISSATTCQMTLPIISHPCSTICGTGPSQAPLLPVAGSESFSWSYVLFSHTLLSVLVLSSSIDT